MNSTRIVNISPLTKLENKFLVPENENNIKIDFLYGLMHYKHQTISVSDNKIVDIIPISSILYIKSDSNYSTFHMVCGKQKTTSKTLKYWHEKISDTHFLRCHNSYLINAKHVKSIDINQSHIIVNENIVPISRLRKNSILKFFS